MPYRIHSIVESVAIITDGKYFGINVLVDKDLIEIVNKIPPIGKNIFLTPTYTKKTIKMSELDKLEEKDISLQGYETIEEAYNERKDYLRLITK